MTEAEKVALRYQFVQDQLSAAQGDFARTSDSWANQCRILSLQTQSLMATIGQGLINLFTPVIKVINIAIGKLATLANAFKACTELITGNKASNGGSNGVSEIAASAADAGDSLNGASDAASNLTNNTNKAGKAAQNAAKKMKSLMGFDQINKLDSHLQELHHRQAVQERQGMELIMESLLMAIQSSIRQMKSYLLCRNVARNLQNCSRRVLKLDLAILRKR